MPTSEIPRFGEIDTALIPDRTPIPFVLVGYTIDRTPKEFSFTAVGTTPLGLALEAQRFMDDKGKMSDFVAGMFFDNALVNEDKVRFRETFDDTDLYFIDAMLGAVVQYLYEQWSKRPTLASAGSSGGRSTNGASATAAPASPESTSPVSV